MSEFKELSGHCLCGAVKVVAHDVKNKVGACHCEMCRRWGGGPFMELNCGSNIAFEGEDNITVFDSSDWAERGFCRHCGTHLFYRLKQTQEHMVPVGVFANNDSLQLDMQVFIDKKPGFYSFSQSTKTMTEAEIFEMFGGS